MSPTITITFDPADNVSVRNAVRLISVFTSDDADPAEPVERVERVDNIPGETDPRGGVELDANGTPWIEEVHAGGKTRNQDGTWRKKRGVQDSALAKAEAAARAELAGTPEPVEPESTDDEPELPMFEPVDYMALVAKFTDMASRGRITTERMMQIYEECGTSANDLATNETARARVMAALEREDASAAGLPG